MSKFEKKIFWKDKFNGVGRGGIHFRSFDLNKFIKEIELNEDFGEVVGLSFEGNNVELIYA